MHGREQRVLLRHYLEQGLTKTAIAEMVGVDRTTIYRWIRNGQLDRDLDEAPVRYAARRSVPWKLDSYNAIIRERLKQYPELSAVRLFDPRIVPPSAGPDRAPGAAASPGPRRLSGRSRYAARPRANRSPAPPGALGRRDQLLATDLPPDAEPLSHTMRFSMCSVVTVARSVSPPRKVAHRSRWTCALPSHWSVALPFTRFFRRWSTTRAFRERFPGSPVSSPVGSSVRFCFGSARRASASRFASSGSEVARFALAGASASWRPPTSA
jgi:predicted DNA-binding transcriptional regulator AlpA